MGIEVTRVNADTVQQRHAQTIYLTAVHEYTTVACYQVSRGETGDPPSSKKHRHGHLWLGSISLIPITLESNTIPLVIPSVRYI